MGYFMTIDAGTGSGRAIIFDMAGKQVGIGQEEWTHIEEAGVANSMSFDTQANWKLLSRCIRHAITSARIKPDEIRAETASSMREGIVLYDASGKELFAVANVDARAGNEVAWLNANHPGLEAEFYGISGQTFALGALPRLLWVKENRPTVYERTENISMISDWVLARLSGTIATDPSNGGTSGIFSLSSRNWEIDMAQRVGLKDDIFPPVFETGSIIGEVTAEAADATGLQAGTPVVMGGGDVQLGAAGLGVVNPGQAAVLGGTFWQQLVNMDAPVTHPQMDIRINPHVIPGISQAEGITFFSGLVMRWFRDTFCQEEKKIAKEQGIDPYSLLERMAERVPAGSHGVLPVFSDAMHYGRWYHAAPSFLNLSLDPDKSSKAVLFRALQENAAIVSMLNLKAIYDFTGSKDDSITFAAGASKGKLWPQILADVTGKTVHIPAVTEATALGGAFACGVAVGHYDSIAEAAQEFVQWERTYEPNRANETLYADLAAQWQEAYAAQRDLVDRGITTSMWKAPGL